MTIRFLCPRGHKLAVPDNLAGKKGRCPICQQRVYIPLLGLEAAAEGPSTDGLQASADGPEAPAESPCSDQSAQPAAASAECGVGSAESSDTPHSALHAPHFSEALPPPVAVPLGAPPEPGSAGADANGDPADGHVGPPPVPPATRLGDGPPPLDAAVEGAAPPVPLGVPPPAPPGEPTGPQELSVIIDEPEEGYQADPGKVQTTYMLAMALGALTLLCAAPALRHPNLMEAPNWARVVLIASALQLVFICWMVSLPDWSTVWICMVVFAFVAALYGVAWAVITFTPDYMPVNFLDLDEPPDNPVRTRAGPWCFVMLMLATLLTYACGRFSGRWRKQYEMAKAMRE